MFQESKMYRSTITGKGQVIIPAEVRKQHGLKQGDWVVFLPGHRPDKIRLKLMRRYTAREIAGLLGNDRPYLGSLEAEREAAAEEGIQG